MQRSDALPDIHVVAFVVSTVINSPRQNGHQGVWDFFNLKFKLLAEAANMVDSALRRAPGASCQWQSRALPAFCTHWQQDRAALLVLVA